MQIKPSQSRNEPRSDELYLDKVNYARLTAEEDSQTLYSLLHI